MRQSGKTTQMLLRAVEMQRQLQENNVPRRVMIVVADANMVGYCNTALRKAGAKPLPRDQYVTPQTAIRKLNGKHRSEIFVDHAVWENWTPDVDRLHDELERMKQIEEQSYARMDPLKAFKYYTEAQPVGVIATDTLRGLIDIFPDPWCECEVHS